MPVAEAFDLKRWIQWLGFSGSLCLAMGGLSGFLWQANGEFSHWQQQIVLALTWTLGSLLFIAQAVCVLVDANKPSLMRPVLRVDNYSTQVVVLHVAV